MRRMPRGDGGFQVTPGLLPLQQGIAHQGNAILWLEGEVGRNNGLTQNTMSQKGDQHQPQMVETLECA